MWRIKLVNTNDGSPGSLEESNRIIVSTEPYGIPCTCSSPILWSGLKWNFDRCNLGMYIRRQVPLEVLVYQGWLAIASTCNAMTTFLSIWWSLTADVAVSSRQGSTRSRGWNSATSWPMTKTDGRVCLCGDQHPMPTVEDLLPTLAGDCLY